MEVFEKHFVLASFLIFGGYSVDAALNVTSAEFAVIGINNGLEIEVGFSGVSILTCFAYPGDTEPSISIKDNDVNAPIPIDVYFINSGFYDIALSCFGDDDMFFTLEENFYVGDLIAGIDVTSNSPALAIPLLYPLASNPVYEISFTSGTDVNITIELSHSGWSEVMTLKNASVYTFNISMDELSDSSGLFLIVTTFTNPLTTPNITKYRTIALQKPILEPSVTVQNYPTGPITTVMINDAIVFVFNLADGQNLTFSLTLSETTSGTFEMLGSSCPGQAQPMTPFSYTFNTTGNYSAFFQASNYVDQYNTTIDISVIHPVNSLSFSYGDLIHFDTDLMEFAVTILSNASLPMGVVNCTIYYGNGLSGVILFDLTESLHGNLPKTVDTFSDTNVAGWYDTVIYCSNGLPDVLNTTITTMENVQLFKVVNKVENIKITHTSLNVSHHPFSEPITFSVELITPGTDKPLENMTCVFYFDSSGDGTSFEVEGYASTTSNISHSLNLIGDYTYTITANCSNLLDWDVITCADTITVYWDCWESGIYFDDVFKTPDGALTFNTNDKVKLGANVRLTDICNGSIEFFWTITFPNDTSVNASDTHATYTATVLNLPEYIYDVSGLYKFTLTIYFPDQKPVVPVLADFIYVNYEYPDIIPHLAVDGIENDMLSVWIQKEIEINSAQSHDPAFKTGSPLTRNWTCKNSTTVTEEEIYSFMASGDYTQTISGFVDCPFQFPPPSDDVTFKLGVEELADGVWYILVLELKHDDTNRNISRATALKGLKQEPLDLEFQCQSNCHRGLSNMDILTQTDFMVNIAVKSGDVQNNTLSYVWGLKMYEPTLGYVDVTDQIVQNTNGYSSGFLFSQMDMQALGGEIYIISCTVTDDDGLFAATTLSKQYAMNRAPENGTCTLTVASDPVEASLTDLTFKCVNWEDENRGNLQYAAVQVFLNDTGGTNITIPPNILEFSVKVEQTFRLLKPHHGVNNTRVQVWIMDSIGPPYAVFDFENGDLAIKPALENSASGAAGALLVEKFFNDTKNLLDSALMLNDLSNTANAVQLISNALPTDTPVEKLITPEKSPEGGGYLIGMNAEGKPLSSADMFQSLEKNEIDPTTLKCMEITKDLADSVLLVASNQSADTKEDPNAQTNIARAVQSLALQKNNLNNSTLEVMNTIVASIFNNTKDLEDGSIEYTIFLEGLIRMSGSVAEAMSPNIEGVVGDASLPAIRKQSVAESVFASDATKEAVENGKLSDREMQFYKSRLAMRKKHEVYERKNLCNKYSREKTDYQKTILTTSRVSDGSVKSVHSTESSVAITKDTSEKLANRTLTGQKSSVRLPGLAKVGMAKTSVGIFEQKAIAHLDKDDNVGGITSGEQTLIINTGADLTDPIILTQKIADVTTEKVQQILDPDDASKFTYFMVHVKNEFDDLNFFVRPDPDPDVDVKQTFVYILYVENFDYVDSYAVSKVSYTAKKEVNQTDWTAQFSRTERLPKSGVYKVGVEFIVEETNQTTTSPVRRKRSATSNGTSFDFGSATMACMTWDDSTNEWRSDECDGTWKPDTGELQCSCKPKKELTFANSFYVAPNKIDFSSVFLKFSPLNQAAVMATLILIFIIYIVIIIWARRQDRKDFLKWGITPLSDNFSEDNYFYVIKVFTGMRPGAGTKSRVSMVITGDEMDTGIRELADGVRDEFPTGSVLNFLMSTTVYLGDLDYIRMWHDNSGSGSDASWYISKIEIHDVQRNESFTFLAERWLAVEKEDGLLECVLPVCKSENLNVFKNRFFLNAKDNLAESHIWVSVAYRPQASSFTRTQRASCALMFIMLTMISNAMFFRSSGEDNFETPSELQVGPFRFSLQQIYISFVCALIVTPPTLIVIYLFKLSKTNIDPNETLFKHRDKASRYKIPFMNDWLEREQRRSVELERHLVEKGLPNSDTHVLPQWCRKLAWLLIVVASFLSAFFVMLYSMQWGKQKSEEWLTTFLLSFFESVFCLDPVKVAIMALIFALIFRSAKEGQAPVNRSTIMKKYSTSLRARSGGLRLPAPPLDQKKLEKARSERTRDLMMRRAFRDIIVNVIIIWILFSISYSNRDVRSYYMHEEVADRLLKPKNMPHFSSIKTTNDFFDWLNSTAILNSFPEFENDGKTELHWRERQFVQGGTLFRVGPPRLRQLRTPKKRCENPPNPEVDCYKKYSESSEETGSYCIGWKDGPCSPDEMLYDYSSDAWRFTSAFDIWGLPISGTYTTYGGGGYIAKLSVNRHISQVILNELYNSSWVDRQTRAVLFEFTLYCLNANIFTYNMFLVEFPETGGAFPFYVIFPMRVYLHQGPMGMYTIACELLFVLYLIYITVVLVIQLVQQKKAFFKDGWQVYELIFVVLSYVAIIMNIVQLVFTDMSLDTFRKDKKAFVNFYHLAMWNMVLVLLIGVLVFMATLRMLNILGYNKRINAVARVFTKAASDLLWFGLFFTYVFSCYAAFGFLLFGWKLKSYRNVFKTMGTLFISMIGKSRFTEIEETDPVFSKIYFMCFIFCVVYMILTMFLAVLSKAIDQVHAETKTDKTDELVDYMIKKMKGMMSYGGGAKKGSVKPAPWNKETSVGRKRRGMFNKATNREILQEIRESMQQALTGNRKDFKTPPPDHAGRKVAFRN